MATLYIDPIGGAAGDMMLGALVSAGADFQKIREAVMSIPGLGVELTLKTVKRGAISASKVFVKINGDSKFHDLESISKLLDRSDLAPRVKERSLKIFTRLSEAEKIVHSSERGHFHEVGDADAIADVVGSALAMELLDVDKIFTGPLRFGTGSVDCSHGTLPAASPAAIELSKGLRVRFTDEEGEFTTPTGAAIIAALAERAPMSGDFIVRSIGYGAGDNDYPGVPNVLRVFVGELANSGADRMVELSANIDDCPAELIGAAVEKVLAAGAADAYTVGVTMKKSRPGVVLEVLVSETLRMKIEEIIFRETTTLGIRRKYVERTVLAREFSELETQFGKVKVKIGFLDGKPVTIKPEYESARALSEKAGVPLKEIYRAVMAHNPGIGGHTK